MTIHRTTTSIAYIKSLRVRGFKSFGEEAQKFTFTRGINLIVGANGSGKSNILDAISFALCSKTSALRVRYNAELQSTDTKEPCEVVLELAVTRNDGHERIITLSVTINPDDSRHYRVDSKVKSVKDAKEMLQEIRLHLEGSGAVVHQSRVTELADSNSSKLLVSIISDASGAGRWNEEVERAQQELKKTRKGLDDIQENILLLEKIIERDQACLKVLSSIKQLESEVSFLSSQLRAFLSEELLCLRKEIDAKVHLLNSEECKIKEHELILHGRKEKVEEMKKQLTLPTGNLENERIQLLDSIAMKEEQKSTYERKLQAAQDANLRLGHLDQVMQSIAEKVSYINLQIEQKQGFVIRFERHNSETLNTTVPMHFYLEELKDSIIASKEKLQELHVEQLIVADSLNFLSAKKESKERRLTEVKNKLSLFSGSLRSFKTDDSDCRKQTLSHQISQLEKLKEDLKPGLQRLSAELGILSNSESALPAWPLHSCFSFKKGLQDASRYFLAMNIISGSLKKTCVTETTEAAADLLRIWERHGNISRFCRIWPLDRLRVVDRFKQHKKVQQKYPEGSVIFPIEHLDYDIKFEKAIKRVFGSYVISSSDEVAKDLILQHGIWSVTVDGKVSRLGSVTGGWRGNSKSNYIQAKFEHDHCDAKLNSVNTLLTSARKEMEELETSMLKFEALIKENEEFVQEINSIEEQIKDLGNNLNRQKIKLEENQELSAFLKKEMETRKKQLDAVKPTNHSVEALKVLDQALQMAKDEEIILQGILDDTLYRQEKIRAEKKELQDEVLNTDELIKTVHSYEKEIQLLAKQIAIIENNMEDVKKKEEERSSEFSSETEAMNHEKLIISEMKGNIQMMRNCILNLRSDAAKDEKELETLPLAEVDFFSLCKEKILNKSDYYKKKRKLNSMMEDLKKLKLQETQISLEEKVAFNEQMGKLELFKERYISLADSIDILTEGIENTRSKVQVANETTYKEIRQSFVDCCKVFLPTKRLDLIKTGQFVEDGIKFSFSNSKEGSEGVFEEWKSNLEELSGGQRTVLSLAFILMVAKCSQSSVYLMDEIDAALDEQNQQSVAKLIESVIGEDNQVICVSHNITFQRHCDRIIQVSRVDGCTKHIQSHTVSKNKLSKKTRIHNN